ncbi:hypothetical protein BT63DRAFT_454820 [Microthyrium microscopicum]|uniref:lytic cellulose monooxygenase (C4-dehydrogenating) n=1 Tax=Microthyrium microscopicum TaxID=703497 RepID=A0A6A6UGE7_9PEZI|nr:hypothetical protein BT63DRAFT_454820 [Microthyrium microscopicum]
MKSAHIPLLFASLASAHSAVSSVIFDGTRYPARDARMDRDFNARRIEWNFKDMNGFPWLAVNDVQDPAITCGLSPTPPELTAVARAGSEVTVQWSGIIQMHYGPVLTYLGKWEPGMTPQEVNFFKIKGNGFDTAQKKWANEELIDTHTADTMKIPSDIPPGTYILRTELLALHGNTLSSTPVAGGGPQFYTHCFNVNITSNGTATPSPTVRFPGGYKREDPGVAYAPMRNRNTWSEYIVPGPAVYKGVYGTPVGERKVVELKDTGAFPPEVEKEYEQFKKDNDAWAAKTHTWFNKIDPHGNGGADAPKSDAEPAAQFIAEHLKEGEALKVRQKELKAKMVKLGIANP